MYRNTCNMESKHEELEFCSDRTVTLNYVEGSYNWSAAMDEKLKDVFQV